MEKSRTNLVDWMFLYHITLSTLILQTVVVDDYLSTISIWSKTISISSKGQRVNGDRLVVWGKRLDVSSDHSLFFANYCRWSEKILIWSKGHRMNGDRLVLWRKEDPRPVGCFRPVVCPGSTSLGSSSSALDLSKLTNTKCNIGKIPIQIRIRLTMRIFGFAVAALMNELTGQR